MLGKASIKDVHYGSVTNIDDTIYAEINGNDMVIFEI